MLYAAMKNEYSWLTQFESTYEYIGRVFTWFFSMYGGHFDQEGMAIKFKIKENEYVPEIIPKLYCNIDPQQDSQLLCVYDPLISDSNTTQKTFRYSDIRKVFENINQIIYNTYQEFYYYQEFRNEATILNRII